MTARQINFAKLPSFWSGMSFVNKANYLCSTHQARDYNEAASMLAHLRRRPRSRPSVAQYQAKLALSTPATDAGGEDFVEWVEPFGPKNEPVFMRVPISTAIAHAKAAAKQQRPEFVYANDQQALDDFIAVHWADRIAARPSGEPGDTLHKLIADTEAAHFRTNEDTGSNPNALLIWNIVREHAGLPRLTTDDLPSWCAACDTYHKANTPCAHPTAKKDDDKNILPSHYLPRGSMRGDGSLSSDNASP